MAAVTGLKGRVAVTSVAASSSTGNTADLSTDGVTLTIGSTGKRHWPPNTTSLVVNIGGTATTDAYTPNYVTGQVTFSTAHSTGATYTIDVAAFTASFVGECQSWSASVNVDMRDHTVFSTSTSDAQWRTVAPGLAGGTVTLNRFWAATTGPAFFDRLAADARTVIELWADHDTRSKLEGYAFVGSDGFTVPVDGDAGEDVSLTLDGALNYTTL